MLKVILPLRGRANTALPVSVVPAPVIDYGVAGVVKIAGTQRSAKYQLYLRSIPDGDFVHRSDPSAEVIRVNVAGEPEVWVRQPPRAAVGQLPPGYTQLGEARPGSGGELVFELPALTRDSLVVVQAQKEHHTSFLDSQADRMVPSAVPLEQAAVILVRPNPAPPLRLRVWLAGAQTNGDLEVFGGQPGVFYHFRLDPAGEYLGLPAYFHQRADDEESVNKGLGQLAIGVDYVVTRPLPPACAAGDLARVPPEPPLVRTDRLPTGAVLHIRAVKAQTGIAVPLDHTPQISAGPEVGPEEAVVAYGGKTKIRITTSRAREWYQLRLNGSPLSDPVKGTGQDRLLSTGELCNDAVFELLITHPAVPPGYWVAARMGQIQRATREVCRGAH